MLLHLPIGTLRPRWLVQLCEIVVCVQTFVVLMPADCTEGKGQHTTNHVEYTLLQSSRRVTPVTANSLFEATEHTRCLCWSTAGEARTALANHR